MNRAIFAVLLMTLSASAELPASHPLRHARAHIIDRPRGWIPEGGIHLHEVARYILGSDDEATAARRLLESAGYGSAGIHYILCSETRAVADGRVFTTAQEAVMHLVRHQITAALYLTSEDSFPRTIPSELTYSGLALRALDWHK